jgi:metallophosphoesterase (TIGR00282 family)
MSQDSLRILIVGDIVGEPGRSAVACYLPGVIREKRIDLVVANAENAAGGFGITPKIAKEFFEMGIHVLTGGNHIWDKKEIIDYLDQERRLLRPANYPPNVPGAGSVVVQTADGRKVAVLHLMGRIFMPTVDCPFRVGLREVEKLAAETGIVIVDLHAEATSEKMAIGWYLDGRVSGVFGTHTHVPTADERILPGGTAYLTDIGMTGPRDSVIGIRKEMAIEKFLTQTPRRFETAPGPRQFCAAVVEVDPSGRAVAIERVFIKEEEEADR